MTGEVRTSHRRAGLIAFLAVMGPGVIAGLSDDDPAGITTYSVLGAKYGYQMIWTLIVSTIALVLFQDLGARIGVVTRQGLIGLIRQKYGARAGALSATTLMLANLGTMAAEFAGIAAAGELFGLTKYVSVPLAAIVVTLLVTRGNFGKIERVFFALSAVFICYVLAAFLAHPDWGSALHGSFVPSMPLTGDATFMATATLGTTLAPWGLTFIQSYAVDKRLTRDDLRHLRMDVWVGSILTAVIGFFVIVTCAATLHRQGISINDASDAARALKPLAGDLAQALFAVGLIGAALLAASILPLSTAYAMSDLTGRPAALDDSPREAPLFYGTFTAVTIIAAAMILLPGVPLVTVLVASQVLNAVLLLPLMIYMYGISADRRLMGDYRSSRGMRAWYIAFIVIVSGAILAMFWFSMHSVA
ncbi:MAG: NRAMP family divalent metal transporter [Candidatus Nanopelagicales bacterium]